MSKISEEVLLVIKNVRNKKSDGTLYMMGERMGWMLESKDVFNISYMYADIKAQKISAEKKDKVQLQIIMNDNSANTFLFTNPLGRDAQLCDREAVKELLQQLLPKFKRKISSELEEKNRVLQQDPEAFQLYKDLVVSGVLTPEEFWSSRSHMLSTSVVQPVQNVGVSPAFLADVKPETDGANGLKYNLTSDIILSIFRTYPMVKKKHAECVPHTVSESEFWTRFFQSHYFHRDRYAFTPKDIFTECAKNDEEVMKAEIIKSIDDPLVDMTVLKDVGADEEYRGIGDDNRSSNNSANQAMIKHFNQHSTLVLRACASHSDGVEVDGDSNSSSSSKPKDVTDGSTGKKKQKVNGSSSSNSSGLMNGIPGSRSQLPAMCNPPSTSSGHKLRKKRKIREKLEYKDLNDETNNRNGVSLRLTNMDHYLHGPTTTAATTSSLSSSIPSSIPSHNLLATVNQNMEDAVRRVAQDLDSWGSSRQTVLTGSQAISALGELSPGGCLMPGTSLQQLHKQVSPATREEMKQQYNAICELLRHFWACFPVSSKSLEEKLIKMRMTLERFDRHKLAPLKEKLAQYHYAMNLTGHLEEMLKAAYNKFDLWQEKRNARRT